MGWERLLAALDPDPAAAASAYQGLHQRLAQRFAWRGGADPEALADATFDRVADKLAAGEEIADVVGFVLGVARFVGLEAARHERTEAAALERERRSPAPDPAGAREHERMTAALDGCLDGLPQDDRSLMLDYHAGQGQARIDRRRQLAEARALGLNALRIRVHRLRERLRACVEAALGNPRKVSARPDTPGRRR